MNEKQDLLTVTMTEADWEVVDKALLCYIDRLTRTEDIVTRAAMLRGRLQYKVYHAKRQARERR